jgi:hypothetical protein
MATAYETFLLGQYSYLTSSVPLLYTAQYVSATTASVTLAVPSGFNTLEVRWRAKGTTASAALQLYLQFNGDTGGNYNWEVNQVNNTTVAGSQGSAVDQIQVGTMTGATSTANYFASGMFQASGASDAFYKTVTGTGSAFVTTSNMYAGVYSGQWSSTAAITSMLLFPASGSLAVGSRFSLYVSY